MKTIPLSQGYIALVDDEDYEKVSEGDWHVNIVGGNPYARRGDGVYMHRFVTGAVPGTVVDHKFGRTLDNQKENIRVCAHVENCRSFKRKKAGTTSQFIGVSWYKRDQCWRAYLVLDNRQKHLGYFDVEVEAARAYDVAALSTFGNLALQNFKII